MASLKGGETLWSNATLGSAAKSALAYVGPGPYVCLFISNPSAVALTFKVQVSGTAIAKAGRNALDSTADGGLTWYDYTAPGGTSETAVAVGAGATLAFDLAPCSPEFIRLLRTDAGGSAAGVSAFVTSFGPN